MRDLIIEATIDALKSVKHPRFFRTERGYHGRFYCALQSVLDQRMSLDDACILEMEYQKSSRHGTGQRPDIVLHIPAGKTRPSVKENNYAVWAFKRKSSVDGAVDDFRKLDEMFELLCYSLGFFINIGSDEHLLKNYTGAYPDRIIAFAVRRKADVIEIRQAYIEGGQIIEPCINALPGR
ncbi:MAG TPA: hypothetical protein VFD58_34765 [Blastocatellia bacterium]|nr:hypothetical protein [Blastocatellia bacterium]